MEDPVQQTADDPLKHVITSGIFFNGLSMGLKQSIRALESRDAQLCVLAQDCNQKKYVSVITGLCSEAKVPIYKAPSRKKLGEMLGLCKVDREGKPRKVVGCSCFIVRNSVTDSLNINACKKLATI